MPRVLVPLIKKEVLDLIRDPKILIGMIVLPAVLYPVMGVAMKTSMSAAGKAALQLPVAILDLDGSSESRMIASALSNSGKVVMLDVEVDEALNEAYQVGSGALVLIPRGFGEYLESGKKGSIEIHVFFKSGGFSTQIFVRRLENTLQLASKNISAHLVSLTLDVDPEVILDPLEFDYGSVFRGKVLNVSPQALAGTIIGQMTTTPVVAMLVLLFAMQIAATSVAVEKEERTLETLLTLPTSRRSILLAKLAGSAVVASLGSAGVMTGLWYYLKMMSSSIGSQPTEGLIMISPGDLVLLAVALVAANMLALTIAIILAVFAENVRSAQTLVGNLYILIFIPAFMLMFSDIETLPLAAKYTLTVVPFTHLALATQHITWGEYAEYAINVLYLLAWSAAFMLVADRIFSSEKVLTARIRWGWKLRKER